MNRIESDGSRSQNGDILPPSSLSLPSPLSPLSPLSRYKKLWQCLLHPPACVQYPPNPWAPCPIPPSRPSPLSLLSLSSLPSLSLLSFSSPFNFSLPFLSPFPSSVRWRLSLTVLLRNVRGDGDALLLAIIRPRRKLNHRIQRNRKPGAILPLLAREITIQQT